MGHAEQLDAVRNLVAQTLSTRHADNGAELPEAILISGGHYCGRRFDAPHGHAIWYLDDSQIVFYDLNGRVTSRVQAPPREPLQSRAAA